MSVSLSSFSKKEIPEILHALTQYKKMLKEMGNRATQNFFTDTTKDYRAEYDPTMDISVVEPFVVNGFQKYFSLSLKAGDIQFSPNPSLISGVRIFVGDDLVDITFKKIENTLKQL